MEFSRDPFERYDGGGPPATLRTAGGDVIKQWPSKAHVRFAELVKCPNGLGGGQLVLLGFSYSADTPLSDSLCAFDPEQGYETLVWQRRVKTEEVLPELRSLRGATGDDFRVEFGGVHDIFPDSEFPNHPGPEIRFSYHSQSVIRIYDLRGQLLYQVWHDGLPYGHHWMADARLLVFAGDCQWPYYDVHGKLLGDKIRDFVVFALRPEPGAISDRFLDYLSCDPDADRLDPAWYLRLRPDDTPDIVRMMTVRSPPNDPGHTARCDIQLRQLPTEYVIVTIDDHGDELPARRIVSEGYKYNQSLNDDDPHKFDLPDPDAFEFVPMTMADVMPGSAYSCSDTRDGRP